MCTQGWDCTGHMWRQLLQSLNYSCLLVHTNKNTEACYSNTHTHTQEQTRPHLSHPPQWKGRNRFLPCGVSELLRQTEQELTTGRSLQAHNAQMGPWTLQHLFLQCTHTQLPQCTHSEQVKTGTKQKITPTRASAPK